MILEPNHNKDEVRDPVTGDIIDGAPFLVKPVPLQETPIRHPAKSVIDGELLCSSLEHRSWGSLRGGGLKESYAR